MRSAQVPLPWALSATLALRASGRLLQWDGGQGPREWHLVRQWAGCHAKALAPGPEALVLAQGQRVRLELVGRDGQSVFGAIDQCVTGPVGTGADGVPADSAGRSA